MIPAAPAPRTCRRHAWERNPFLDAVVCTRCHKPRDEARVKVNANNRNRGKGTSRDLADYLGWQNVEGMNWPWDVQANHGRIQAKRDQQGNGAGRCLGLIRAIPAGAYLRGVYHVAPGKRLTSGTVTVLLGEWIDWYGLAVPGSGSRIDAAGGAWLLRLPLNEFDLFAGKGGQHEVVR